MSKPGEPKWWPSSATPPPEIELHEQGPRTGDVVCEQLERHHRRRYHADGGPAEDHHAIRITRRYKSVRLWQFLNSVLGFAAGTLFVLWAAALWTTGVLWAGMLGVLADRHWGGTEATFVLAIGLSVWVYIITADSVAARILFAIYSLGVGAAAYIVTKGDPYSIVLVFLLSVLVVPLILPRR